MKKYNNLVSQRITQALKDNNVSQTELAQMIEKSRAYVSNITKGRYVPKISELMKISEYLKKPMGYFFGEDTPGLMHYVEKAKKWEKLVALVDKDVHRDLKDDVASVPLLDNSKLRNRTFSELIQLRDSATNFIYLSQSFVRTSLKYFNKIEDLVAVRIFIRDYPAFGIALGDILILEPIENNDIGDKSGNLFGVLYKGDIGVKRIYRDVKQYYFEPIHSNPQIEKISIDDPDLVIPGRVVFNLHVKVF